MHFVVVVVVLFRPIFEDAVKAVQTSDRNYKSERFKIGYLHNKHTRMWRSPGAAQKWVAFSQENLNPFSTKISLNRAGSMGLFFRNFQNLISGSLCENPGQKLKNFGEKMAFISRKLEMGRPYLFLHAKWGGVRDVHPERLLTGKFLLT